MKKINDRKSLAASLLSLGVVDEEITAALLRQGVLMAARAANEGDARNYKSLMELLMSFARLEQDERHKLLDKVLPDQQMLTLTANGQPVSPEQLWQTMFSNKVAQPALPSPIGDQDENEIEYEG